MTLFIILMSVCLAGIGFVIWLIANDKTADNNGIVKVDPSEITKEDIIRNALKADLKEPPEGKTKSPAAPRLNKKEELIPEASALSGLKDFEKIKEKSSRQFSSRLNEPKPVTGTASLTTSGRPAESSSDTDPKYAKLNQLLTEKNKELEDAKVALDNEIRNRKEFEKVKSILDEEISTLRNNLKDIQNELKNSKSDNDNFKKKVAQLEEKATKLEKEIAQKEQEIDRVKTAPKPENKTELANNTLTNQTPQH